MLLLEMVVPTGTTPAYAKLLDLLMLVYAGGRERSEAEFRDLLMSAGFSMKRIVPTASAVSIIEATPGQAAGQPVDRESQYLRMGGIGTFG